MWHLVLLNTTKKLCSVMNNGVHTWHRAARDTKVDGFFIDRNWSFWWLTHVSYDTKHVTCTRWSTIPNRGSNPFSQNFRDLCEHFVQYQLMILVRMKCHNRSLNNIDYWAWNGYHILSMVVQYLLNTCLCGVHYWSHTKLHTTRI